MFFSHTPKTTNPHPNTSNPSISHQPISHDAPHPPTPTTTTHTFLTHLSPTQSIHTPSPISHCQKTNHIANFFLTPQNQPSPPITPTL